MTTADDHATGRAARAVGSPRGWFASVLARGLLLVIASACAILATNNWCFVLFPAALAALLLDSIVRAIGSWFVVRVTTAAFVGVVVGILLSVGPDWAFREAFGLEPPNGVHDAKIWRHFVGGPGEHTLIIEFTADDAAFQTLVRAHPPQSDSDRVKRWKKSGGAWDSVLDAFAGAGQSSFVHATWRQIRSLNPVEAYDLGESNYGSLSLFRETGTGRCVAFHVRY